MCMGGVIMLINRWHLSSTSQLWTWTWNNNNLLNVMHLRHEMRLGIAKEVGTQRISATGVLSRTKKTFKYLNHDGNWYYRITNTTSWRNFKRQQLVNDDSLFYLFLFYLYAARSWTKEYSLALLSTEQRNNMFLL